MQLEQQVVSLELARKLKDLGVNQQSCFTWVESYGDKEIPNGQYKLQSYGTQFYGVVKNHWAGGFDWELHPMYAAFTVAELGEMLIPAEVHSAFVNASKEMKWICTDSHRANRLYGITEADARAKMLIYLLENKLINQ